MADNQKNIKTGGETMEIEYQTLAATTHANLSVVQQMNYPETNTVLFIALPNRNFSQSRYCVAIFKIKKK